LQLFVVSIIELILFELIFGLIVLKAWWCEIL